MKKTIIKLFDRIVLGALGMTGLASSCEPLVEYGIIPVEYGTPNATYEIKGVVTAKKDARPVQNIRITRKYDDSPFYTDTVYTDAAGKYEMSFSDMPQKEFTLRVEDVDGAENGGYFGPRDVAVTFTEADRTENGSGNWNEGKFAKTQNVEIDTISYSAVSYGVMCAPFKPKNP